MIYKVLIGSLAICFSVYSHAGCVGPTVSGECLTGTHINGYGDDSEDDSDDDYESNTGTRYQYDLKNPADSNRYSIDLDAQRRDQMNLNPRQDQDRSSGQYGGGIYDD
jgi:hypothetical protein